MAKITPKQAETVISAFCTAGLACSSSHLSSLDSDSSCSSSVIEISAECIRYL